jgi:voltage-gated potassium channel Kch
MSTPGGGALAPGRFRLLLLALVLFIVATAALPQSGPVRFLEFVLLAGTLVIALVELRVHGESRLVPIVLASSVIFVTVADQAVRLRHLPVIAGILVALFSGVVVWLAYASVMRPHRSVSDRIVGAICVYLLIGLAWASLFETLDFVVAGSFRFPPETAWATPGTVRYRYFSFVTLATLGYGDVTPQTALAGTLAALEAVTGQLYIGITVARLVALSLADRAVKSESSKPGV